MFGRCALRLRQCIHFAPKRGVLSRRSAAGSGPLVARHRQVHAPCEAETRNGHKRRSAKQAHRCGVLGYKGARRKRLVQRNAWEAAADVKRQFSNDMARSSRRPVLTHSGVSASVGCGRIAHREAWSAFGWVMRTGERAIYLALEVDRSWTEMTGVHERRVVDAPFC